MITEGKYTGLIGIADYRNTWKTGKIIFYPSSGERKRKISADKIIIIHPGELKLTNLD